MNEHELLRDVARLAAAMLRAEAAYQEHMTPAVARRDDLSIWTPQFIEENHRLAKDAADREDELVRALDRLAAVNPELVGR